MTLLQLLGYRALSFGRHTFCKVGAGNCHSLAYLCTYLVVLLKAGPVQFGKYVQAVERRQMALFRVR